MENPEFRELAEYLKGDYKDRAYTICNQMIKYLREEELKAKGMGVLALVEFHNNGTINTEMFDAILPAIEQPTIPYKLIQLNAKPSNPNVEK